jgi:F0F1-type ATP synthase membrane subunit c/vacuolar-type H+-ATPase subunit K
MFLAILAKILVFGGIMVTLGGAAIGTGVLFSGYLVALSRNPEETDNLFNGTMMGFALIETFVFLGILLALGVYFLI